MLKWCSFVFRCNNLSDADMRMSIRQAPEVLTIQLKRFDPLTGRKLNKYVEIKGNLNLAEHMTTLTDESNELPVSVTQSSLLFFVQTQPQQRD